MQKLFKFGERLSELMLYADNIKSDRLGEAVGVNGSTIRLWITGSRNPSLQNAVKLADYFRCPLNFLFGRSDDEKLDFTPQPVLPFYERFVAILKERGKSWYKVSKDTKISKSNIQDWRDGREPLMPILIDIANYLDITLDYLVGRDRE